MDLLDNIKDLGHDLPAYFCLLLSMMVIGILHFTEIIVSIFVVLVLALLIFPEQFWILGSIAVIYGGALRFKKAIIKRMEELLRRHAPYLFIKISHNWNKYIYQMIVLCISQRSGNFRMIVLSKIIQKCNGKIIGISAQKSNKWTSKFNPKRHRNDINFRWIDWMNWCLFICLTWPLFKFLSRNSYNFCRLFGKC